MRESVALLAEHVLMLREVIFEQREGSIVRKRANQKSVGREHQLQNIINCKPQTLLKQDSQLISRINKNEQVPRRQRQPKPPLPASPRE